MRLVVHISPCIFTTMTVAVARIFLKKLLAASPRGKSDMFEHVIAELVQIELAWDVDGLAVYVAEIHDLQEVSYCGC